MSATEAPIPELEGHVAMPNGGTATRCQRVKKDGLQCAKPARREFTVCSSHGAGYRSREAAGERRKPGRPVTHGAYSLTPTRSYAEAAEELAQLEDALTNSDNALLALKALLVYQLGQLDALAPRTNQLENDMGTYVSEIAELDATPLNLTEGRRLAREFASWLKPLTKIDRAVDRVADTAPRIFAAHKARAETASKLAEAEGTTYALKIIEIARGIAHELFDPALAETYELALKRELYGPLRLDPPPLREVN